MAIEVVMNSVSSWRRCFAFVPHQTISGKWIWLRWGYRRRIWAYTGFIDEIAPQWANLFDIMANPD